jgi:hypothetical protein
LEFFQGGTGKWFCFQAWGISDIFVFETLRSLEYNKIGAAGAKSLADALKVNTTLQTLK